MSRAGVNPDTAERCLGHAVPGIRGVYDRHHYLDEMRAAFEALAAMIEKIVSEGTTSREESNSRVTAPDVVHSGPAGELRQAWSASRR